MAAVRLGHQLSMFADSTYTEQYVRDLPQMREDLAVLGVEDTLLPESAEEFRERPFDAFMAGKRALEADRGRLGGDGFALPFFTLQFMLYRAVKHSALGLEWEDERTLISVALYDLNLEAEEAQVQKLIRKETLWIQSAVDEDDVRVRAGDVMHAWARLSNRILNLWREAEAQRAKDLPPIEIEHVPQYSCFVSYSFADEEFCKQLHERLKLAGIQVWFASHDMTGGKKIRDQVQDAIGSYDKLLLVLSEASMGSNWVEHELYTAFHREKDEGRQVLFPIRIVSFEALRQWQAFDADTGRDLAREIREYFIPDFSEWEDEAKFEEAFSQLVDSLRKSEG
jgi:hypothetical protein